MKKVMLKKEEAEALESALDMNGGDKTSMVVWHVNELWDGKREPLNDLNLETVCTALFVGYEIELGPEEKILKWYEDSKSEFYRLKNMKVSPNWDKQEKEEHWGAIDYFKNELNTLKQVIEILEVQGTNC